MRLLLVDLDNTLIDRAGAFSRWAREFAAAHAGSQADARWLAAADRDGLESRERLAAMIAGQFGLGGAEAGLLAELRGGLVRHIIPDAAVTGHCAMPARPGGRRSSSPTAPWNSKNASSGTPACGCPEPGDAATSCGTGR